MIRTAMAVWLLSASLLSASNPQNIVYIMLDDADYFDVGYNNGLLS